MKRSGHHGSKVVTMDEAAVERLLYWISERESIRLKRAAGQPPPWTDDPVLRTYRFCNVRRMDDRVSLWLLHNWYLPNRGDPNMLWAVALARFINLPSSLALIIGDVFRRGRPSWGKIKTKLRLIKARGDKVFNGAYMVRGNDGVDKIESVVEYNVRGLTLDLVDPSSMEATWSALSACYGFGSFMAGQVTADLRWAVEGEWADRDRWAPMGPGSRRGLNRLLGLPVNAPLSQATFLQGLGRVVALCRQRLPRPLTSRLEVMDIQNCLCEFDKYSRVLDGGRLKQTYRVREAP